MAVTRIPPPSLVIPGLFGGLLAHWQGVPAAPTQAPVLVTAALFCALGAIAIGWPIYLMSQAGTPAEPWKAPTALIVKGPYRYSRNPIYVGFLFLQAGVPLWWGFWMPLALVPLTWALLHFTIVKKEEAYLKAHFEEYEDYLNATRRWL